MKSNPICVLSILLAPLLFLSSCASTSGSLRPDTSPPEKITIPADSSTPEALFRDTLPIGNKPLFFGMSNRHQKRTEEAASALEDAARQASRYLYATGKAESINRKSNEGTGYAQQVTLEYDQSDLAALAGRCTVLKEYQDTRGTYIVTQFDTPLQRSIALSLKSADGEPHWVKEFPQIPGYAVCIGVAQAKRLLADSIRAADEQAFADALRQVNTEIKVLDKERSVDRGGTQIATTGLETASGSVRGFYVIARGVSADGRYYYSLAVCPESNLRR